MIKQVSKKPTKVVFDRLMIPVRLEMERIKTDKKSRSPSASKVAIEKTKKLNDEKFAMNMKRNFTEKHEVDNTQYKLRPKQRKDLYG